MRAAREGHTAVPLPDGKVLVVGGDTVTVRVAGGTEATDQRPSMSAELYDPASGTWTDAGKMVSGGGAATLLLDGNVLVVGGSTSIGSFGGGGYDATASELYDPRSGTWKGTRSMLVARGRSMATLLPDGKVLIACGCDHAGRAASLFDPATGSWAVTGTMVADHWRSRPTWLPDGGVTAMLLPNGQVLVAGGGTPALPAAELYDPGTGSWTATAPMLEVRVSQTTTLLRDGTVLVAGGEGLRSTLASAELYDPGSGR